MIDIVRSGIPTIDCDIPDTLPGGHEDLDLSGELDAKDELYHGLAESARKEETQIANMGLQFHQMQTVALAVSLSQA